MRHLGIARAHIVGHSSGGNIALQLALDAPQRVHSLALLEPALPVGATADRTALDATGGDGADHRELAQGRQARRGRRLHAHGVGPGVPRRIRPALPGAFERGVADADTFFDQELPAIQQWQLARDDAGRITQPVLAVMGAKSPEVSPIWKARQQLMLDWLPNVEGFVLPETTHLLHVQNPRAMAEALAAFFARHPVDIAGAKASDATPPPSR